MNLDRVTVANEHQPMAITAKGDAVPDPIRPQAAVTPLSRSNVNKRLFSAPRIKARKWASGLRSAVTSPFKPSRFCRSRRE